MIFPRFPWSNRWLDGGWLLLAAVFLAGCGRNPARDPKSDGDSHRPTAGSDGTAHDHGSKAAHDGHGANPKAGMRTTLRVTTDPAQPEAGSRTKLSLEILGADGKTLEEFDVLHEKLVHLIVVRAGLDEFAHLHPEVDPSGKMSAEFTFPKAGQYHLFADHQPKGSSPGLAIATIKVSGNDEPAPPLAPNASGEVAVGEITAKIDLQPGDDATLVRFRLVAESDKPVLDLKPYLGAMGHLVVISADGSDYVHAHPVGDRTEAPDGVVEFAAHFPKPGLYKMWGQFQRGEDLLTVPFVVRIAE